MSSLLLLICSLKLFDIYTTRLYLPFTPINCQRAIHFFYTHMQSIHLLLVLSLFSHPLACMSTHYFLFNQQQDFHPSSLHTRPTLTVLSFSVTGTTFKLYLTYSFVNLSIHISSISTFAFQQQHYFRLVWSESIIVVVPFQLNCLYVYILNSIQIQSNYKTNFDYARH